MCVNALNGLSSFLPPFSDYYIMQALMCQRPKRAFFISTEDGTLVKTSRIGCQRPKRAFFISTFTGRFYRKMWLLRCVNALNGLSSFLRGLLWIQTLYWMCVNALNGLSSFLRT